MATPQTQTRGRRANRPEEHTPLADMRGEEHEADHATPRVRRRKSSLTQEDMFYIPKEEIPDGLSYEWKRWTVNGAEDPFYFARMREDGGWEPVEPSRHPNWLPKGYKEPYIIKGGLILMERPVELTNEARAENEQLANRQVITAEQRLGKTPKDTLTRDFDGARPKIVKEVGRMVAIEE